MTASDSERPGDLKLTTSQQQARLRPLPESPALADYEFSLLPDALLLDDSTERHALR